MFLGLLGCVECGYLIFLGFGLHARLCPQVGVQHQGGRRVVDGTCFGYAKGEIPPLALLKASGVSSMEHDLVTSRE